MPTLHLVRHGVALDRGAWPGSDQSRPLTEFGWRQSLAISCVLAEQAVQLFCSSPTVRCCDTLMPAAHSRGLEVTPLSLLFESNEPQSPEEAVGLLKRIVSTCLVGGVEVAAAATHGNILLPLLTHAPGGGQQRCPKGGVWRLELSPRLDPLHVEFQGYLNPKTGEWAR